MRLSCICLALEVPTDLCKTTTGGTLPLRFALFFSVLLVFFGFTAGVRKNVCQATTGGSPVSSSPKMGFGSFILIRFT